MKVAVTVWGDWISPVFDSARTFLILETQGGVIINRRIEKVDMNLSGKILELGDVVRINVLICGALSIEVESLFKAGGVEVIPFISGAVEEMISSFVAGSDLADFIMPGCSRRCCRQRVERNFEKQKSVGSYCDRIFENNSIRNPGMAPGYFRKKKNNNEEV